MSEFRLQFYRLLTLFITSFCFLSSEIETTAGQDTKAFDKTKIIVYATDSTNFSNPERGFFEQSESGSSSPSPFTELYFNQLRNINVTLIRRLYSMTTFRKELISESYIKHIQDDMDMLRTNGLKIILRFAYTFNEAPPWDDAPLALVLSHIDQLTPVLQKNADVIAVLEAGFIGRWGEWHTSSNKLDNPDDMRTILFKLLKALPESRNVVVRYQRAKKAIYQTNLPIGEKEAFDKSNRSRTGHLNDCFVASSGDWGTYMPEDVDSINAQKNYLNKENKYVAQVGESCNCNPPRSDCEASMKDFEMMRWSSINMGYEPQVLKNWKRQGCYDEIAKRLGYRLRLIQSEMPKTVKIGSSFLFNFTIKNDGFASPYNPRDLELVFRSQANGSVKRVKLDFDPRRWLPDNGEIKIRAKITIPSSLAVGEYDLLLNLPDPEKTLNSNPGYSIRLANKGVWEPATGFNSLMTTVQIIN